MTKSQRIAGPMKLVFPHLSKLKRVVIVLYCLSAFCLIQAAEINAAELRRAEILYEIPAKIIHTCSRQVVRLYLGCTTAPLTTARGT